jgi:hypothetical protein
VNQRTGKRAPAAPKGNIQNCVNADGYDKQRTPVKSPQLTMPQVGGGELFDILPQPDLTEQQTLLYAFGGGAVSGGRTHGGYSVDVLGAAPTGVGSGFGILHQPDPVEQPPLLYAFGGGAVSGGWTHGGCSVEALVMAQVGVGSGFGTSVPRNVVEGRTFHPSPPTPGVYEASSHGRGHLHLPDPRALARVDSRGLSTTYAGAG